MAEEPSSESNVGILGVNEIVGGELARTLLLIGMHARMVMISTEISFLLQSGFPEATAARVRTLYELVIKALVILGDKSQSGIELAERYYISSLLEWQRSGGPLDDVPDRVLERVRTQWGASFFRGDNNWALPAMPEGFSKDRVSFKDLEDLVEAEDLRHMYVECNAAIHAGALRIVSGTSFRRRYLYTTRSEIDLQSTGRLGQATVFFLEIGTYEITRNLTHRMKQWDYMLHIVDFVAQAGIANRLFRKGYDKE